MKWVNVIAGVSLMQVLSCASFNKKTLHSHLRTLSSDEFDGRAPMTEGEAKTITYLENEFNRLNMKQFSGWQGFRQPVPLARIDTEIIGPVSLSGMSLKPHEDVVITSESLNTDVEFTHVPVIFVGYGITAQEFNWDDYQNLDVKNKIVVTLVNDPGFASDTQFHGKDMTYYGRWTYKFEEALRRGALGALVIHETDAAGYGFQVVQHKSGQLILNNQNQGLSVQGWLSLDAAKKIFARANLSFDTMKAKALSPQGGVYELGTLTLKAKNSIAFGQSHNVCGYIEGDSPHEFTAVSAHWDHLGSKLNQLGGKEIYRGAIDNGTGIASLLELARYFSQHKPKKSLLLCSFTAEEQGLLGAQHFVLNPPVELSSIKGMLNLDCMNVGPKHKNVVFYGPRENKLYSLLSEETARQGRKLTKDHNSEKGYFYRSDHRPFVAKGVPALLFMDLGISNPDYLQKHYHQPSDAHDESWPLDGMIEDLELLRNLIVRL